MVARIFQLSQWTTYVCLLSFCTFDYCLFLLFSGVRICVCDHHLKQNAFFLYVFFVSLVKGGRGFKQSE
jgi:hypothetical protein